MGVFTKRSFYGEADHKGLRKKSAWLYLTSSISKHYGSANLCKGKNNYVLWGEDALSTRSREHEWRFCNNIIFHFVHILCKSMNWCIEMHWARKEKKRSFCKSHSRKLSIILIRDGRFSGVKPIYLLNYSNWLYMCHTFSESCKAKEDNGNEKMIPGVYLKPPGISFSPWTQTGPWSDTSS